MVNYLDMQVSSSEFLQEVCFENIIYDTKNLIKHLCLGSSVVENIYISTSLDV